MLIEGFLLLFWVGEVVEIGCGLLSLAYEVVSRRESGLGRSSSDGKRKRA